MIIENTKWAGKEWHHFEVLDSTNKMAREFAEFNCAHGTLVSADMQNAGMGRRGRSWSSEKGAGIYMSLILRPEIKTEAASMLTLVAAIAVAKAISVQIQEHSLDSDNGNVQIKWPNDIVINGKKICGILTELYLNQSEINYVVLGIGINVTNFSFPQEIVQTASSIWKETGVQLEKEALIEQVWIQFENYYEMFLESGNLSLLKKEYESLLSNKNNKVKVLDPLGEYEGIAQGITEIGELIVETEKGKTLVSSGEVSVRGIYGYV